MMLCHTIIAVWATALVWANDSEDDSGCSACKIDRTQSLSPGNENIDQTSTFDELHRLTAERYLELNSQNHSNVLVRIGAGSFFMGTDAHVGYVADKEGPQRLVTISHPFYLEQTETTNAQFAEFVHTTGYVTDSERFEWSFGFDKEIPQNISESITQGVAGAEWWLPVPGASWRHPVGTPAPDVFSRGRAHFPAVHLSWADADAYCRWRYTVTLPGRPKGFTEHAERELLSGGDAEVCGEDWEGVEELTGRLPTEAEWEYAARGLAGRVEGGIGEGIAAALDMKYPWGNKLMTRNASDQLVYRANYFQGKFPTTDTGLDGHRGLAPAQSFLPQNDLGFYNLIGNAWEWVEDWWDGDPFSRSVGPPERDPTGPLSGRDKVKKGGSYLCHSSYCNRYRLAARTQSTPDSAASHTGVRCLQTKSSRIRPEA